MRRLLGSLGTDSHAALARFTTESQRSCWSGAFGPQNYNDFFLPIPISTAVFFNPCSCFLFTLALLGLSPVLSKPVCQVGRRVVSVGVPVVCVGGATCVRSDACALDATYAVSFVRA